MTRSRTRAAPASGATATTRGRSGLRTPADALARAIAWGCVRTLIGLLAAGILVFHLVAIG